MKQPIKATSLLAIGSILFASPVLALSPTATDSPPHGLFDEGARDAPAIQVDRVEADAQALLSPMSAEILILRTDKPWAENVLDNIEVKYNTKELKRYSEPFDKHSAFSTRFSSNNFLLASEVLHEIRARGLSAELAFQAPTGRLEDLKAKLNKEAQRILQAKIDMKIHMSGKEPASIEIRTLPSHEPHHYIKHHPAVIYMKDDLETPHRPDENLPGETPEWMKNELYKGISKPDEMTYRHPRSPLHELKAKGYHLSPYPMIHVRLQAQLEYENSQTKSNAN